MPHSPWSERAHWVLLHPPPRLHRETHLPSIDELKLRGAPVIGVRASGFMLASRDLRAQQSPAIATSEPEDLRRLDEVVELIAI
jgi:hypothetical protein